MKPATSTSEALWLASRLDEFGRNVGSVIPTGFESYARIFHPMKRDVDGASQIVRWKDIANAHGRSLAEEMRLVDDSFLPSEYSPDGVALWDEQPTFGTLPLDVATRLVEHVRRHTVSGSACFYAYWTGWPGPPAVVREAPEFLLPHRAYVLLEGRLDDALVSLDSTGWAYRGANIWWPQNRAWCVATEIDYHWTYVGGTAECVRSILDDPFFEAIPTTSAEGNFMQH